MKLKLALLAAVTLGLFQAQAHAMKDCSLTTEIGSLCDLPLSEVRPTQFSVGMKVVNDKAKKLKGMDEDDYKDYLKSHPLPAVIGNGGQFYILDHHHLSRAVYEIGKQKVVIKVMQNWNTLSSGAFWDRMKSQHYIYLMDADGTTRLPSELPRFIQQLGDDPYRSLSGYVRDQGGFIKGNVYYIEFIWAQYFRARISPLLVRDYFKTAVKQALDLAHSTASSSMPGYTPTAAKNID